MLFAEGLDQLIKALAVIDQELHAAVKDGLRAGGQIVQQEADRLFSPIDADSAAGFRTYVRAGGRVSVEQSKRKTTGAHPEFGELQMTTALIPARDEKLDEVGLVVESRVGGLLRDHGF